MGLETYWKMRDFRRTPEPRGKVARASRRRFVVQEHHASKLHFDFRLEMGGVLKSWSIPRGPSLDPAERRLAVPTEDHPVEYLKFEGEIPAGEYGAGKHMRWDGGTYELLEGDDPLAQLEAGKLTFGLKGEKLRGAFSLVRTRLRGADESWLLIKRDDEHAEAGWRLELREPVDGKKMLETKRRARVDERNVGGTRREARRLKTDAGSGKAVPLGTALKRKEPGGDVNVKVGREVVPLTSLDRVYWPDEGYTKADLIRYYDEVAEYILPYLKDRPLIMKRYPAGIGGQSFHQHDASEAPEFVRTVTLKALADAHEVDYVVGGDRAAHVYMANLGAIERHPWHSRVETLEHPDWFVFDLDPGAGVEAETICEVALAVRDVLARVGLKSYPKTSGSRGLHVYVPIKAAYSYEEVAGLAERIATVVARENAAAATIERSLAKRKKGRIYVDHMQNAHGKSVVAPYSVRPKPGAPVSAPLEWKEVERRKVTPRSFDINNIMRRVESRGDLFKPVLTKRQSLDDALAAARELTREVKVKRARG